MRRIFVPLQGPDDARALLPYAGDLAVRFGAQVEAALIADAARLDEELPDSRAPEAIEAHALFTRWSETPDARGIAAGWREIPDGVVYASASLGRASDLIVTRGSGDRRFRNALLASGRLTLLVPSGLMPSGASDAPALLDHVVLAWDGSAGAAHALGPSIALLAQARSVRVIIIGRNTVGAQAREAILSYMALHNGQTRLVVQDNAHRQTGRALLEAIREQPASLVIMGVCGRSHPPGSAGTLGTPLGGTILKVIEDGRIPILTAG